MSSYVAGVDEVGVGAIAGPIAACAVVLSPTSTLLLRDSKQISSGSHITYLGPILRHTEAYSIQWVLPEHIQNVNRDRLKCMAVAAEAVMRQRTFSDLYVDGDKEVPTYISQHAIIKGDTKISCIQAGAIIAKVARDWYMVRMDELYPGYGFKKHKGYPTPEHKIALKELGLCPIHRIGSAQRFLRGKRNRHPTNYP